jgi:hypothetical protein
MFNVVQMDGSIQDAVYWLKVLNRLHADLRVWAAWRVDLYIYEALYPNGLFDRSRLLEMLEHVGDVVQSASEGSAEDAGFMVARSLFTIGRGLRQQYRLDEDIRKVFFSWVKRQPQGFQSLMENTDTRLKAFLRDRS